jgi:hypothetical protein
VTDESTRFGGYTVFTHPGRKERDGKNIRGSQGQISRKEDCAGIFKQSMRARNRVAIGLWYRPARLNRLTEWIPWNRFLGSLKV